MCSFPAELSAGRGLSVEPLLSAFILSKCASMVAYCLRGFDLPHGDMPIIGINRFWAVYLTVKTLWGGDLVWLWPVDSV